MGLAATVAAYRPGETIRQSGIYEVMHDREHRAAHEAVMIGGEHFPDCETCKDKVRFRLVRTAPYIFQDEDFEENVLSQCRLVLGDDKPARVAVRDLSGRHLAILISPFPSQLKVYNPEFLNSFLRRTAYGSSDDGGDSRR